jgi:hypothetical protein
MKWRKFYILLGLTNLYDDLMNKKHLSLESKAFLIKPQVLKEM